MTVTREPADRAEADDTELAALEAAAEQAKADARRAAQAVRLARRARAGKAAGSSVDPEAVVDDEPVAEDTAAVPLTKSPSKASSKAASTSKAPSTSKAAATAVAWTPGKADDAATVAEPDVAEPEDTVVDDDVDPEAGPDDADEPAADDEKPARRRPRRVTVLATVFALLAAVFVVIATIVYTHAQDSRTTSPAAARDQALVAARQDIVVLNTLDYTDVDGGLQRWLGATTGTLHDQLSQVSDADKQAIAVSKSVTTASVLAAAVTQVDATRGNATVIASVQIDVKPATGDATSKRNRFSLTMTKVGDVWKISAVQQVPVTLT